MSVRSLLPAFIALSFLLPYPAAGQSSGLLLVVNKGESTLSVVDLAEGREVGRVPTGYAPHEVAVSPDGLALAPPPTLPSPCP